MQWWDWMPRFKFFKCWVSNIQIYMYCIINYSHILYLSPSGLITGSLYHLISFTYINSYFLKKLHLLSYHLLSHCSSLSKFSAPTFLSRPCLFPLHPFHILSFHILLDNWNFSIVLFRSFWLIPLLDSRLLVYILLGRMIVSNSELDLVGYIQSMGSRRVGHNWGTSLSLFTSMHWRRKWQSTPVFLPGESQGQQSLVDCSPMDCSLPGSSVHGIFQARVLEWGAIDVYCCPSSLESMVVYSMGVFASTFQCLSIVYTCTSLKHETLPLSPGSQSIPPTLSLAFQKCWIKSTNQTSTLNFKTDFWCTGGSKTFGEKGNSFVFWFLGD